jgi:predicted thioesterase
MAFTTGLSAAIVHTVTGDDTAESVGSGDVPVLASPRLLALAEAACVAALSEAGLDSAQTSVGTRMEVEHLRPSPVGEVVRVAAELVHVDGRLLRFEVVATDEADLLVGRAVVTRVVVDRERFLRRLSG